MINYRRGNVYWVLLIRDWKITKASLVKLGKIDRSARLMYHCVCPSYRTFDDETIVYDFPNEDSGPSAWQSYGTGQTRYHK